MPKEIKAEYRSHKTKKGKEIEAIYLNDKLWRPLSGYSRIRRAFASHIMDLKEYYGFYIWLVQIAPDDGEMEGVIEIPMRALEQLLPWKRNWIDRALRRLHNHPKAYVLFYPAKNQNAVPKIIIPKYSDGTWEEYRPLMETKIIFSGKSYQGIIPAPLKDRDNNVGQMAQFPSQEVKAEYRIHKTSEDKEIEAIYLNGKLWRPLSGHPKTRRGYVSHIEEIREYYGFYIWLVQIAADCGDNEGVIDIPMKALEQLVPWERRWIDRALRRLHNHPKTYIIFYSANNQFDSLAKIIIPKYSTKTWGKYKHLVEAKKHISAKRYSDFAKNDQETDGVISTKRGSDFDKKDQARAETPRQSASGGASKPLLSLYNTTKGHGIF